MRRQFHRLLFFIGFFLSFIHGQRYRPVVLMHGIAASANDMDELSGWIREVYSNIYVFSVEIGNGPDDSFFLPMNRQVELFCSAIDANPNLKNGFNLLGFSQGSVIVRAAVERCSLPVYNLITMNGMHQGIFGVPNHESIPPELREIFSEFVYDDILQNTLSIAGYWRDPYHLHKYLKRCHFLPDINNELPIRNETYRLNMLKLNAFVMTYSDVDQIIEPPQSGWFLGFQSKSIEVESWNQSRQFTDDLLGLRTLWEEGKLHFFTSHTPHGDSNHAPNKQFIFQNIIPFFNNTFR